MDNMEASAVALDICRTCGAEDGIIGIFDSKGEEIQLAEKINTYLPITVTPDDEFPLAMCQLCTSRLESCHKLVLSCLDTNERLLQLKSDQSGADTKKCDKITLNVANCQDELMVSNEDNNNLSTLMALNKLVTEDVDNKTLGLVAPNVFVIPSVTRSGSRKKKASILEDHSSHSGYFCDGCQIWYKRRERFMAHQLLCPLMTTFLCVSCGYKAEDKIDLKKHTKIHSNFPETLLTSSQNSCNICNRVLSTKMALKLHLRIHSGEKPYSCEYCQKSFAQKNALKYHEKTHANIKPYNCRHCDKGFNGKMVLETHERIHTGERPYQCVVCDATFRCLANLRQHQVIHTEEKQFECPVCQKMFRRPEKVRIHLRTHTGEKPYVCSICNKGFAQKGDMMKHKFIHFNQIDAAKQVTQEPSLVLVKKIEQI